jgi:GNAT superfamily N-acetyltransferase
MPPSGTPPGEKSADVVVRGAALAEIIGLRHAVLRAGMPRLAAEFDGDDEPATLHVGAFLGDGTVAGCASAMRCPFEDRAAHQLRGMATRPDLVGRGIGLRVLRFVEGALAPGLLWCNARAPAVGFYRRAGWTVVSDVFDIPGAGPHRRMIRGG